MIQTAIVALLLCAPGDTLIRANPGKLIPQRGLPSVDPVLWIPFNTPGDYATGDTTLTTPPTAISISRASVATYENPPGTLVTATANRLRVAADGALIEQEATNFALNSATHPKTAEASVSITTGTAVAWHAGTGTMTIVAGTATVTGLSCTTVAAGTPCRFTVTVAGTMLITTTAGTTRVQIEKGSLPTSYIDTLGTAVTRSADLVTFPTPAALSTTGRACFIGSFTSPYGWVNAGVAVRRVMFANATAGFATATSILHTWEDSPPARLLADVIGSAPSVQRAVIFETTTFSNSFRTGFEYNGTANAGPKLLLSGGYVGTTQSTNGGDGTLTAWRTPTRLGGGSDGHQLDGFMKRISICTAECSRCREL